MENEKERSMKFTITGGSGFIGTKLSLVLAEKGYEISILDLNPPRLSDTRDETKRRIAFYKVDLLKEEIPLESIDGVDAVIHLAGVNIFSRWTPEYKRLIVYSRVKTAQALIKTIEQCANRPRALISASAAGYYGSRGEEELTEESSPGNDFLAEVCINWEKAILPARDLGLRTVSVRTAPVLGHGGLLRVLVPLYKKFLGGTLGNGRQWFPWIHRSDLISIYEKAAVDDTFFGSINAASPNPVRNREFNKALAKALGRPAPWRIPAFAIKLALGELGTVALSSQRVIPVKLKKQGFVFAYENIADALDDAVSYF